MLMPPHGKSGHDHFYISRSKNALSEFVYSFTELLRQFEVQNV